MPGSLSVIACPSQNQSAEALRKVRAMVLKAGAELAADNVFKLELANGSRALALPGTQESIRGLTVDAWIVADEAAQLDPAIMAALHPMRTQRPDARFAILSTAWSRTNPFWSVWENDDPSSGRGNERHPTAPPLAPAGPILPDAKIAKSQLALAEPRRIRDKAHLKFVASQPCIVCGRQPSDPHHLRFAQPRAMGLKVSDEFTVPLCRGHHRQLHQAGNEEAWWENLRIDALEVARGFWVQTHRALATKPAPQGGNEHAKS